MTEQLDQWRQGFLENAAANGLTAPDAPAPEADTATQPEQADEQPRDEQGRYAAKDTVTEPEPPQTEQPAEGETPPEEGDTVEPDTDAAEYAKYLEKYGNDPEKASRAGFEASKLIGRQSAEVHDARQIKAQFEELKAMMEEQRAAAAAQAQPQYTADDVQQYLDEYPAHTLAEKAIALGDDYLYSRAMQAWAETDPAGAMDYAGRVAAWKANNQMREELAPLFSAAQTQQQMQTANAAVNQALTQHADFVEVIQAVPREMLDNLHPAIKEAIEFGDTASKAQALDTLYYAAKGVQAERQPQAQAAAQAAAQQNARQQRTDAAVGSAQQANPQQRESSSNVDAWREQLRESPEFRKAAGLT